MAIPTEPIGSIPRPRELIEAIARSGSDHPALAPLALADRLIGGH